MIKNNTSSTCTQAIIDLITAAKARGDDNAAQAAEMLSGALGLLSDDIISAADRTMSSHQYPDHTLTWGRFYVDSFIALPFDYLDADSAYLAAWLARHISGYSNYIAFKIKTLLDMGVGGYKAPWSSAKLKRVLSDLQAAAVLVPVDRSYSHEIGTVYMLDPSYIDMAGTESRRTQQQEYYDSIAPDRRSSLDADRVAAADEQYYQSHSYVQPITITLPQSKQRARVSWITVPKL